MENDLNEKIIQSDQPGIAIPLVSIVNKKFVLNKEAIEILNRDENKAIGIVSLVGKYRTGKSFLLNRVILNNNVTSKSLGFSVGPTVKPCTKGIWMYSKPMKIVNNHYTEEFNIYFIDTEGLGAYDEEVNHDSKIFLIAILISSLFLLNSFSSIDENAINNLSLILNLTKTIKFTKDDEKTNPEEISKFFPSLLWILRDFSLKLEDIEGNTITAKQYLENALSAVKGSSKSNEDKNIVRQLIKLYFQERDCYTMIRPVESEEHLQNLNTLQDEFFRSEFLVQCEGLKNRIFKKVKPKIFNGKILSGKMTVNLISSIIDSLNQGAVPVIESTWNYVVAAEGSKAQENILKEYSEELNNFYKTMKSKSVEELMSLDINSQLNELNKTIQLKYLSKFEEDIKLIDEANYKDQLEKTKEKITLIFNESLKANEKIFKEKFIEVISSSFKNIENKIINKEYSNKSEMNISSLDEKEKINLVNNVNYHLFFQEIEYVKENLERNIPNFTSKYDDIQQKVSNLIKFFIEECFIKENSSKNLELMKFVNEKNSLLRKIKQLEDENSELKSDLKELGNKNNEIILDLKAELKGKNETISNIEKENRSTIENYQNQISKLIFETQEKGSLNDMKISNYEEQIKQRDYQINNLKFNEEKIMALNSQKTQFLDKEIDSLKEKIQLLTKLNEEQKQTIENYSNANEELRKETVRELKSYRSVVEEDENNTLKEKQIQIDNLKLQLEDTKRIYEEVIENFKLMTKEKSVQNEEINNGASTSKMNQEYKEIVESNKVILFNFRIFHQHYPIMKIDVLN